MTHVPFAQPSYTSLEQRMDALLRAERAGSAEILRLLAEMRRHRSYAPAGYSSLWDYCVKRFRMSEDMTAKRLQVVKAAQRCPGLLDAIADGRLHLTGARMLVPHLTSSNAPELIAAATGLSCEGIRLVLAERYPAPDVPTRVEPVVALFTGPAPVPALASPRADVAAAEAPTASVQQVSPEHASRHVSFSEATHAVSDAAQASAAPSTPSARVAPIAPQRFAMQLTISRETHDKLRRAQDLLGHTVPSQDLAQVLDRALDALITKLEKQRFAKTDSPRKRRSRANGDYIPADMKRRVAERDGHRCTFESPDGVRCESRRDLQYDHVITKARGGKTTDDNLRLRCHAHNQYEAERVFGAEFMRQKRERRGGGVPRAGDAGSGGANASPPA